MLAKLQAADSTLPVVVMTAWASVEIAVEAMRRGAKDFVTKPWENPRLLSIVKNQIELAGAVRAYRRLEQENQILRGKGGPNLIAQSPAMRPVLEIISRVGPSDANILITGENGTGKGVVAQALHAVSVRAGKAFISVNMGGLPEGVFESELFGHVRGAFTDAKADRAGRFELADGGTLFMDEIGNIPMSQQAKILRTLETGEFDRVGSSRTYRANVRLISATNSDLPTEVAAVDPNQPISFFQTLETGLAQSLGVQQIVATLTAVFAGLALALAAVGLYSVLAYSVAQRSVEIGIRMALGAQRGQVISLVMQSGLKLVALGVVLGLGAAAGAARLIQTLLYSVQPLDPLVYGGVALLFVAIAALACLVPSLRASRIDPLVALRAE